MAAAVILGSAFRRPALAGRALRPVSVATPYGSCTLYRLEGAPDGWVLFRHALPHRYLPNQIPWIAHTAALREVGCRALVVTSSVGVLDPALPLDTPMLVSDLLMPENRLPDGRACTMFQEPVRGQGHLVVDEGLLSPALGDRLGALGVPLGAALQHRVVFAYVGGPRTKTAAENRLWRSLGAQVNSMSVGPEVVLANELEITTAALVVGHKYSLPGRGKQALDQEALTGSLDRTQGALEPLLAAFLTEAPSVPYGNRIYRF